MLLECTSFCFILCYSCFVMRDYSVTLTFLLKPVFLYDFYNIHNIPYNMFACHGHHYNKCQWEHFGQSLPDYVTTACSGLMRSYHIPFYYVSYLRTYICLEMKASHIILIKFSSVNAQRLKKSLKPSSSWGPALETDHTAWKNYIAQNNQWQCCKENHTVS